MSTQDIWNTFRAELLGFIKSRVYDDQVSEDILQDVFIKIHLKKDNLKNGDKLTGWIYQITRNTIIDYYRKQKVYAEQATPKHELPEDLSLLELDFSRCLNPLIDQLPEPYKDVLSKTVYGDLSQKAYAEINSLSYSTVKSRIQRARQRLKKALIDCCTIQTDKYGNVIDSDCKKCNDQRPC